MFKKLMAVVVAFLVVTWGYPAIAVDDNQFRLITVASDAAPKEVQSSGFKIKTDVLNSVPETVVLPVGDITDDTMNALSVQMQVYETIVVKNFILWFDSDGGIVRSGVAFTNFLLKFPRPTICVVNSHASSMGFYILQGCTARLAKKDSRLMTHEPGAILVSPYGTAYIPITLSVLRQKVAELEAMNEVLAEFMVARSLVPKAVFLDKISQGDWNMTADQALEFGFIDGIYEGPDLEPTEAIVPIQK